MTETPRFCQAAVIAAQKIGYRDDACGARELRRTGSALLKIQPADFSDFFARFREKFALAKLIWFVFLEF